MTLSINQLKEESQKDSFIDKNKIDKYSLELAMLTSKWNSYYIDEKLEYESSYIKYSILRKKKWEYYSYDHQYQVTKGKEMDIYLDSDIDLLKLKEKVTISKEKLNLIEAQVKILNTASFNIKNAIAFLQFQSGSY